MRWRTHAFKSRRVFLSIAIPTYGRETILLETVRALIALPDRADEIVLLDQTPTHETETERQLSEWQDKGLMRWLRLARPSIPASMNVGLQQAKGEVVLFLDDDIVPDANLVRVHRESHLAREADAVTGQVLQPGEEPDDSTPNETERGGGLTRDLSFPFRASSRAVVSNCMAGNLSVRRQFALTIGGFDERFEQVAYRFETEFARRVVAHGGRVLFEPSASIRHLRAPSGGTRTYGSFLSYGAAAHSVGDYYFALKCGAPGESGRYILRRLVRSVTTRSHLRRPLWIPVRLAGEISGLVRAIRLDRQRRRNDKREGCMTPRFRQGRKGSDGSSE